MEPNLPQDTLITLPGPAGALEVVLTAGAEKATAEQLGSANYVVVLCHPHPLHGGSMDNKVITTLMRAYRDLGVTVVRFNFRGVGNSEGAFDEGRGELDDLLAVTVWVEQQYPHSQLLLAGFSFGSAIAAQASYRIAAVKHLLLVAPPLERYNYDRDGHFPCPACVVQGDKDERVAAQGVYAWVHNLASPVELLRYPDASHFFHGHLSALKTDVAATLAAQLSR